MERCGMIVLVILICLTGLVPAQAESPEVIVYYFHGDQRCTTCIRLEVLTTWAVQSTFQDQLDEGRLGMEVVNFHTAGNEHFEEDFNLQHQSVILVLKQNGQTVRWKNLERIWDLVDEAEAFENYIIAETNGFLEAEGG